MSTIKLTGQTKAVLAPGASDAYAQIQQPKPCIVILIHGVNDLAGSYAVQEDGICQGLNERLDQPLTTKRGRPNTAALNPATYSVPDEDSASEPNPDAIYYRRRATAGKRGGASRSVVIPFYWGFRETEQADPAGKKGIQKNTPHGEWLDRYGNRLDKAGTKEGGVFANATTTVPDMFGSGFSGKVMGLPANPLFGSPDHPLFKGPERTYMVLAAQRLAMLVKIIRRYRKVVDGQVIATGEHDTINVVGHSQGTVITLLANAMLADEGQRPVDGFVMMHSPYSLEESTFEWMELRNAQQTTSARLETLANIAQFISEGRNSTPSLADTADASQASTCIGGLRWTGEACETTIDGNTVQFAERDNRGCTFLYFSPQDQTVGMRNVQGIGWQGVADTVSYSSPDPQPASGNMTTASPFAARQVPHRTVTLPALSALGGQYAQRVFAMRERDGEGELVGKPPSYDYMMRAPGESTWEGTDMDRSRKIAANAGLSRKQTVTIKAPALPVPFVPDFVGEGGSTLGRPGSSGIKPVWHRTDPIDASISITNGAIRVKEVRAMERPPGVSGAAMKRALEEAATDLNDPQRNPYLDGSNNAWAAAWHRVARWTENRQMPGLLVAFEESPNEARERLVRAPLGENEAISFHSAIPMSVEHSRRALAYDLAIGQAKSIDDESYYAYLCRVADWRLRWDLYVGKRGEADRKSKEETDPAIMQWYKAEAEEHVDLIDATDVYIGSGVLPEVTKNAHSQPLTTVRYQTVAGRRDGIPVQSGVKGAR
ncbi:T6SS effector phospholipase Tle3 domain-containing protein [Burkholderia sp. IMCC1007]|uniref:T6SS effector phospholipase Tle3 domain-containing protein n=1 Tax=Burkholderia sp. IMCC1007 TaxID=3004104 RepID=UPI0022B47826|nr:DUF3274 domain-containing protein [Burkholderia sp. IMCC1007]